MKRTNARRDETKKNRQNKEILDKMRQKETRLK